MLGVYGTILNLGGRFMKRLILFVMGLVASLLLIDTAAAAEDNNWPQFRGPGALGVSGNANLPDKWSTTENVLWKQVVAGRGWSSPVVWGNQIFVTTVVTEGKAWVAKKGLYFGGERYKPPAGRHHWKVVCLNLDTGKVV